MPSVLIVEDDRGVAELLERLVRGVSDDVTVASDGHEALGALERRTFDRVICDLKLPGPDGLEITRWIVRHRPEIRVLVVSGFLEPSAETELRELGAQRLSKPFRVRRVRAFVDGSERPVPEAEVHA